MAFVKGIYEFTVGNKNVSEYVLSVGLGTYVIETTRESSKSRTFIPSSKKYLEVVFVMRDETDIILKDMAKGLVESFKFKFSTEPEYSEYLGSFVLREAKRQFPKNNISKIIAIFDIVEINREEVF